MGRPISYEEEILKLRDILIEYPKRYEFNKERLQQLHEESIDLLHYAEFMNLNAREGFDFYKEIQKNQQERRKLKDDNEILEPIVSLIKSKQFDNNLLNKLVGDVRGIESKLGRRRYRMKARHDLQEEFDKRRIN